MSNITINPLRLKRLEFFYHYYLFEWNLEDAIDIALNSENYDFSEKILKVLIPFMEEDLISIENEIKKNLRPDWPWDRITPIEKAPLVNGFFETKILKTKKAIVVNEMVNYSKKFGSNDDSYKLVNALLDKLIT